MVKVPASANLLLEIAGFDGRVGGGFNRNLKKGKFNFGGAPDMF